MLKKNNENYYAKLREVSEEIFLKYNLLKFIKYNDENEKELLQKIYIDKLYNFILNMVNQVLYDNINNFSCEDVEFIVDFEIDKIMPDIINLVYQRINIKKLKTLIKKQVKKNNKK